MTVQKYPIGLQDFKEVITRNCVYVDKTKFVYDLITTHKYYFLSRPRRFGKSLLISTFDHLFQGEKELFNGLYIHDRWDFEKREVIRISFSDIGYRTNDLSSALNWKLDEIATGNQLELAARGFDLKLRELIHLMYQKHQKKIVILIDEYDKPLIDYIDKDNLHLAIENRAILKSFYSVIKDADPYLQFVFITGVSKFSQVSIFSDLNNLYDLTMQSAYNEICGISQLELEHYFSEELVTYDAEKIREWYNGYKWNVNCNSVYNPFSLLNFFSGKGEFNNFWFNTGTPSFLLKKSREQHFYQFDEVKSSQIDLLSFDIENLELVPILFQTGYITVIGKDTVLDNFILSFPNKEVKQAYLQKLADTYINSQKNPSKVILDQLLSSLRSRDEDMLVHAINLAFVQIPYDLWQKENEHFYHAIVHLLFSLLGVFIQSEVHTANGRADALISFEDHVYCLEFKLDKSAKVGLEQIKNRGYLNRYKNTGTLAHAIAINFSSTKKMINEIIWEIQE